MFIIPIGTKSSLALKPKVTIGLIAVNILIALITIPLGLQSAKSLFKVQRDRYASEVRLYLNEHARDNEGGYRYGPSTEELVWNIQQSEDYYDLEVAVIEALTYGGGGFEDLEAYEKVLDERTELHYIDSYDGSEQTFTEYKRLKAKEDKVMGGHVNFALGLVPHKMYRIHTFFTYQFIHGGIAHLLGNLLFLWIVGCLLEDSWGRGPFLVFYLMGGALAGLAHCLQDTSSTIPLIGASGAIAAAMGAFTIRHFWSKIRFFYFFIFFFRPFWGTFHLPACVFLPFWFLQQVALKYLADFFGGSDVAYVAHIAGYAMGFITVLVFRATDFEQRFLSPRVQKVQVEAGVLKDPRFNRACELMDKGQVEMAKGIFSELIGERPHDLEMIQDIALLYRENGLNAEYNTLAGKTLQTLLIKSRYDEAASIALDIVNQSEVIDVNPQCLMRVAKYLAEQGRYGESHDVYRKVIAINPSPQVTAKASLALAKIMNENMNNVADALKVLEEARTLQLDAEWMERISDAETAIQRTIPVPLEI
jgi:membrane associated rhomboid family serine protease